MKHCGVVTDRSVQEDIVLLVPSDLGYEAREMILQEDKPSSYRRIYPDEIQMADQETIDFFTHDKNNFFVQEAQRAINKISVGIFSMGFKT